MITIELSGGLEYDAGTTKLEYEIGTIKSMKDVIQVLKQNVAKLAQIFTETSVFVFINYFIFINN